MGFFLTVTLILLLAHVYLWLRWVRDTAVRPPKRTLLTALVGLLAIAVPVTWVLSRSVSREDIGWASFAAFLWMGLLFYLALYFGLVDLTRLLTWPARTRRPTDPDRRLALARGLAVGSALTTGGVGILGVRSALGEIDIREVEVRLERLPRALDGFHLVQLSDLHLGPLLDERFLRSVIARVNGVRPDLVALTGDLVDGPPEALASDLASLAGIESRCGSFLVSGNHEFYAGAERWMETYQRIGLQVLGNRYVPVGDRGPGGSSFDLAGVHDPTALRFVPAWEPDVHRALVGRDPDRELVLLAHQPRQVEDAWHAGVGLQLSGHTHGGQLQPFGLLTSLVQPYLAGLHRHRGRTQIYVSRGTGFWGPPMRIAAPAEITSIRLVSA